MDTQNLEWRNELYNFYAYKRRYMLKAFAPSNEEINTIIETNKIHGADSDIRIQLSYINCLAEVAAASSSRLFHFDTKEYTVPEAIDFIRNKSE